MKDGKTSLLETLWFITITLTMMTTGAASLKFLFVDPHQTVINNYEYTTNTTIEQDVKNDNKCLWNCAAGGQKQ